MTHLPFELSHYLETDRRRGIDVTLALQERLKTWMRQSECKPVDRMAIITGMPGIGKTWFLQWIVASSRGRTALSDPLKELSPDGYVAVYVDLNERFTQDFARQKQAEAQMDKTGKLCLCVDHVPSRRDSELQTFEDLVLIPNLITGQAFVVLALEGDSLDLNGKIPTVRPYWPLDVFKDEFVDDILRGKACQSKLMQIKSVAQGHPYLAHLLCDYGVKQGAQRFIEEWLTWKVKSEASRTALLRVASKLAPVPLEAPDAKSQGKQTLDILGETQGFDDWVDEFRRLGWVTIYRSQLGDRYRPAVWNSIVRACLLQL